MTNPTSKREILDTVWTSGVAFGITSNGKKFGSEVIVNRALTQLNALYEREGKRSGEWLCEVCNTIHQIQGVGDKESQHNKDCPSLQGKPVCTCGHLQRYS